VGPLRTGRDSMGNKVAPRTGYLTHVVGSNGDDIIAQKAALQAAAEHTNQNKVVWQTSSNRNFYDTVGAKLTAANVLRNAPAILDGPRNEPRVLPRDLAKVPEDRRAGPRDWQPWPEGTQRFSYSYDLKGRRDLSPIGKVIHIQDKNSYAGKLIHTINPVKFVVSKIQGNFAERARQDFIAHPLKPKEFESETLPSGKQTTARTVSFHAPRTLDDWQLTDHARDTVLGNAVKTTPEGEAKYNAAETLINEGKRLAAERPQIARGDTIAQIDAWTTAKLKNDAQVKAAVAELHQRPGSHFINADIDAVKAELNGLYLMRVHEQGADGQSIVVGGAALEPNWSGAGGTGKWAGAGDPVAKRTAYLSNVYSAKAGAGSQVTQAAADLADRLKADHLAFYTRWTGAQKMYLKLRSDPKAMPNLKPSFARFTDEAGDVLTSGNAQLPPEVQQLLSDVGDNQPALQYALSHDAVPDPVDLAAKMPDGSLSVRFQQDFKRKKTGLLGVASNAKDVTVKFAENVGSNVPPPVKAKLSSGAAVAKTGITGVYNGGKGVIIKTKDFVIPFGNKSGVEPSSIRLAYQNVAGLVTNYGGKLVVAGAGMILSTSAAQAATGQAKILENDDSTIRPFNGPSGSKSWSIYFPWTGTMLSVWTVWLKARGPAFLTPGGTIQPTLRTGASPTDPTGPTSITGVAAGRFALRELGFGIRWFGHNDGFSATSSGQLRLGTIIANLRGDVPLGSGGARGVSILASLSVMMPSLSTTVYAGQGGLTVRNYLFTLAGNAQTSPLSNAQRLAAYETYGDRVSIGSKNASNGGGLFLTTNPAYGKPDPNFGLRTSAEKGTG
jgi:hypothetical protein